MTFFKVKVRGKDGVVDCPRVLEGTGEPDAKPFGCDEVRVTEGRAMEGDDESPTCFLDPEHDTPVRENDKLVDVGEEREEEDVKDEDPSVDGAPGDDA
jgi:hypothetical protein